MEKYDLPKLTNASSITIKYPISIGDNINYCICLDIIGHTYYFIKDERFIKKASCAKINKNSGYNGLFFNEGSKTIEYYYITLSNGKMWKLMNIHNHDLKSLKDFINKFKELNKIIIDNGYENYSIRDLLYDKSHKLITEEEGKGLTKVVIIKNNDASDGSDSLYFYKNAKTVVARSSYETKIIQDVSFSNTDDFIVFAEEVAKLCAEEDPGYFMEEYIKGGLIQIHYLEFIKRKNKALNELQNDEQLDKLTGQVYNRSAREVKMNRKPERIGKNIQ